jgi:L-aspartate oxidase
LTHASAALSHDFAWQKEASSDAPEDVVRSVPGPGPFSRGALRRLMTAKAGVLRNGVLLREAAETLEAWAAVVRPYTILDTHDTLPHEDANLLLAAQLLVNAAQERTESLGAHYRSDSPAETAGIQEELEQTYRMRPKASLVRD